MIVDFIEKKTEKVTNKVISTTKQIDCFRLQPTSKIIIKNGAQVGASYIAYVKPDQNIKDNDYLSFKGKEFQVLSIAYEYDEEDALHHIKVTV